MGNGEKGEGRLRNYTGGDRRICHCRRAKLKLESGKQKKKEIRELCLVEVLKDAEVSGEEV